MKRQMIARWATYLVTVLAAGPGSAGTEDWKRRVQDNHDCLMKIAAFEHNMVGIFRPHLSL